MLEKIIRSLYGFDVDYEVAPKRSIHSNVICHLKAELKAHGFETRTEVIKPYNTLRPDGRVVRVPGMIDLMAKLSNRKIAIEYDNGNSLKYKSIEKMFSTGFPIQIGIVRGNLSGRSVINQNIERIESRIKKFGRPFREFWLVILTECRLYKFYSEV